MENLELKQMIEDKLFSKEFLELLLENFSEIEVLCFAHKEYLNSKNEYLIKKYPELDVSKIKEYYAKVKLYVEQVDANVDPLKAMENDTNIKNVRTKPDQKHLL